MTEVLDFDTGEPIEISVEEFEKQRDHLLSTWQSLSQQKAEVVAQEKEFKERFLNLCADRTKTKGVDYCQLPNGWNCKITKSIDYGFRKTFNSTKPDVDLITNALSEIAATCKDGPVVAGNLVSWNPRLSVSAYNELDEEARAIIDEILITKPGSTSLEIIPPKEKV